METGIRAKRVLVSLANYQMHDSASDHLRPVIDLGLGRPIGSYCNPEPGHEIVHVFSDGMAWVDNGHENVVRFSEICEMKLSNGKRSEHLILGTEDRRILLLPVKGHRGRLYDSLTMLRFIDRVMEDSRERMQS